jgi:exopolyphosphatase / guanosine-5'-triphosphate,3'-diphosphate pyrophosphatase
MTGRSRQEATRAHPVGVVDIGSNSIRLVVFDAPKRAPLPVFNEKILCGLGKGLQKTGELDPEGVRLALDNLQRFAHLAEAMGVADLTFIATAAVRDAKNGAAFVRAVEARIGRRIRILSGADEARLSAQGVVSGIPDADGLAGDLGGGSLELVRVRGARIGAHATLPLGPLRLRDLNGRDGARISIDEHLEKLDWLGQVKGKAFYAVGGAWRALARVHMAHAGYPLHVIHHYTLKRGAAEEFCDLVAGLSRESLERVGDVSRKRLDTLPLAALVLSRVLRHARPSELVFAATGLREGCVFSKLPPSEQRRDPLIDACSDIARTSARFAVDGQALMGWIAPLFRKTAANEARLRLAACHLSDIAWREHPDYRAEIAFLRTLRMPFTGIDHAGRAFVALAIYTRYEGRADAPVTRPAWQLLGEEPLRQAHVLGLGLRLAYTMSAGTPAILSQVKLKVERGSIDLVAPAAMRPMIGEAVERRLEALARAMGRKPRVKISTR